MTEVILTGRNGELLRVSEDSVEFWVERGYRRPKPEPAPKATPAKKATPKK